MGNIIEINNLEKSYDDLKAVDNISFNVKEGSLFAFLGVNGAGKSTTINIICSILKKDGGTVKIGGYDLDEDPEKIKYLIGVVFQNSVLDNILSVKDNLYIRGGFYGFTKKELKRRIDELSDLLNLEEIMKKPVKTLSGGQKRRVDIARALINHPKILILDEPTTGLDPQTRQKIWSIIEHLRKTQKMTVFLTTHYMEEANKADNVVILDAGHIVATDTPHKLKTKYANDYIKAFMPKNEKFENVYKKDNKVELQYFGDCYHILIEDSKDAKEKINKYDKYITDFEVLKGDMDDVFLNITGKKFTNGDNNGSNI